MASGAANAARLTDCNMTAASVRMMLRALETSSQLSLVFVGRQREARFASQAYLSRARRHSALPLPDRAPLSASVNSPSKLKTIGHWVILVDSDARCRRLLKNGRILRRTRLSTAESTSLRARDARVIANIGRPRFSLLAVMGGMGNRLIEEGGRQVLDLSASCGPPFWAAAIRTRRRGGRGLPRARPARVCWPIRTRTRSRSPKNCSGSPRAAGERRVWFGHSGSDANDCAMRVLQAATGRSRFISFIGSYHGNLSGSMSISGHTAMTHSLPRAACCCCRIPIHIETTSAPMKC